MPNRRDVRTGERCTTIRSLQFFAASEGGVVHCQWAESGRQPRRKQSCKEPPPPLDGRNRYAGRDEGAGGAAAQHVELTSTVRGVREPRNTVGRVVRDDASTRQPPQGACGTGKGGHADEPVIGAVYSGGRHPQQRATRDKERRPPPAVRPGPGRWTGIGNHTPRSHKRGSSADGWGRRGWPVRRPSIGTVSGPVRTCARGALQVICAIT